MTVIRKYIQIAQLIAKDLVSNLDSDEKKQLNDWINKNDDNRAIYEDVKSGKGYYKRKEILEQYNQEKIWMHLEKKISASNRKIRIQRNWQYYAAAVFALILVVGSAIFVMPGWEEAIP